MIQTTLHHSTKIFITIEFLETYNACIISLVLALTKNHVSLGTKYFRIHIYREVQCLFLSQEMMHQHDIICLQLYHCITQNFEENHFSTREIHKEHTTIVGSFWMKPTVSVKRNAFPFLICWTFQTCILFWNCPWTKTKCYSQSSSFYWKKVANNRINQ